MYYTERIQITISVDSLSGYCFVPSEIVFINSIITPGNNYSS